VIGRLSLAPRLRAPSDTEIAEALFFGDACGLLVLDAMGRVVRGNSAALGALGVGLGDVLCAHLPAAAATALERARAAGTAAICRAVLGPPTAERVLSLACLPLRAGAAVLSVADLTHEQALEERLAQSQRLQEVGQLAGGIAHDFNNLLTVILGGVDELLARPQAPDALEDLQQVRASARRGAALVAQLLAFGRRQTLMPRVLSLNQAIGNAAALLARVLGEGVRLTLELEEPSRMVKVDPTQFDQVLVNLAVNARDAMGGQGVLTIASGHSLLLRPETIGAETAPPGRYATVEVRDTGSGIPPDVLPHILEPFFTTKRERGGTGLGLSTVHGIIRQSGGYLAVDSVIGVGTCMRILLPRHEAAAPWEKHGGEKHGGKKQGGEPQPQAAGVADAAAAVSRGEVLLVEDEAPVRRLAERTLIRGGWQVISAACAQDALELLEEGERTGQAPHLACVVSDVVMPGMDGPALVRALRKTRPALPAILVSGYADAPLRAQLASERVRFLSKPFAMADLASAVAAAVAA
jgi:two-component system cell cycle sensor histidine kinase/response regulator CckA